MKRIVNSLIIIVTLGFNLAIFSAQRPSQLPERDIEERSFMLYGMLNEQERQEFFETEWKFVTAGKSDVQIKELAACKQLFDEFMMVELGLAPEQDALNQKMEAMREPMLRYFGLIQEFWGSADADAPILSAGIRYECTHQMNAAAIEVIKGLYKENREQDIPLYLEYMSPSQKAAVAEYFRLAR
jgi:hypothetical protein